MPDTEAFQTYRPLLFSIAYRMLGSASEAEDVIQDAYIRYATAPPAPIRSLKAYLSTIVSRLCLDRLKAAQNVREQYLGPWLPEPVMTGESAAEMLQTVEQRESITLAFLVLLESLTPQERAVFLLREVFEYEYEEIASMLDISTANCRQLFRRAKGHIVEHRPRFTPSPDRQRQMVEGFLVAAQQGDLQALTSLLSQDVVLRSDGGGKVPAATRPVAGRDAVVRLSVGLMHKAAQLLAAQPAAGELALTIEQVNGGPAMLIWIGAALDTLLTFTIAREQIVGIQLVRNPDKLAYIQRQLQARRLEPT